MVFSCFLGLGIIIVEKKVSEGASCGIFWEVGYTFDFRPENTVSRLWTEPRVNIRYY